MNRFMNKRIMLLGFGFLLVVFLYFLLHKPTEKFVPTDGDNANPTSGAFLVYQNKPYLPLRSVSANNELAEDVAFFARKQYSDQYDPSKNPAVVFYIGSKPKTKNNTTEISGKFDRVDNKITISFTTLENGRIKSEIKDTKTGQTMATDLPSSNAKNDFINRLPIVETGYMIDYLEDDSFVITLYDPGERELALSALKNGLRVNSLEKENYQVLIPPNTNNNPNAIDVTNSGTSNSGD